MDIILNYLVWTLSNHSFHLTLIINNTLKIAGRLDDIGSIKKEQTSTFSKVVITEE